jgi:hypothetical protein
MTQTPETSEEEQKIVQFAEWPTEVQDDNLTLVGIRYGGHAQIDFVKDGAAIELTLDYADDQDDLVATFISREKMAGVVFRFERVSAFRVLDEHGLVELWNASKNESRPASTTFKVKGHLWQTESELSWIMWDCEHSFMVATNSDCLEVVTDCEPTIQMIPAMVRRHTSH